MGEQLLRLNGKFGKNEEIRIEVTMFDGSVMQKTDDPEDVKLRVTLIVEIVKGKDSEILEFVCSAWPDSIEIRNVFIHGRDGIRDGTYMGPAFKELDELQDSLYDFLERRGINDKLAEFLNRCMRIKDKNEYLRWIESIKTFIQKK